MAGSLGSRTGPGSVDKRLGQKCTEAKKPQGLGLSCCTAIEHMFIIRYASPQAPSSRPKKKKKFFLKDLVYHLFPSPAEDTALQGHQVSTESSSDQRRRPCIIFMPYYNFNLLAGSPRTSHQTSVPPIILYTMAQRLGLRNCPIWPRGGVISQNLCSPNTVHSPHLLGGARCMEACGETGCDQQRVSFLLPGNLAPGKAGTQ